MTTKPRQETIREIDYHHIQKVIKARQDSDLDRYVAKRYDDIDSGKIRISKTVYPPAHEKNL